MRPKFSFVPAQWSASAAISFALLLPAAAFSQTATQAPVVTPSSGATTTTPAVRSGQPSPARLKIGSGDLLEVTVFDEPSLTQSIRVSDTGDADFSLIGSVHLDGLTTAEAQKVVQTKLQDGNYLLHPRVNILIREYSTQGVSILGEVKNPGVYPILGSRNLLDLISQAGGTTNAAAQKATIKHRSGTEEQVTTKLSNNNPDAAMLAAQVDIQPGDTIFVPRAGIVYVLGSVSHPGGYIMQDDGKMSLLQAVSLAAGTMRVASEGKTHILQKTPNGFHESQVDLKKIMEGKQPDVQLQAEDIVYVPTSAAKSILLSGSQLSQAAASSAVYQGIAAIP